MPYITPVARQRVHQAIHVEDHTNITTAGDLNYLISTIVLGYIGTHGENYRTINETIGVLECAKLELYRRLAAPYEDTKIAQNGDIYPKRTEQ